MRKRKSHWLGKTAVFAILTLLGPAVTARAITLVAYDDSYTAASGRELVVEAPGVLDNDRDGNDNDLPPTATAQLLDDVTNGVLDLSPDGGFSYTPDDGFTGTDSFTYRVVDAPDVSNPATVTLNVTGCQGGPNVFTCWVEASFVAKLTELGFSSFQEGFENDIAWGSVREPNSAVSVSSQGITWQANNDVSEVTTGSGRARTGAWGFYTDPHGDPGGAPFDPLRDGFIGTGADTLVGVGVWLSSNTGGAQVRFALDGNIITFNDPVVTSAHKFFGAIDARGFTGFEIYETEGTVQDQKYIFADDFTIGSDGPIQAPDIDVTPPALDFGEVTTGVTETRMVTIANVGTTDLNVNGLTITGSLDFALNPAAPTPPFTVTPGASLNVAVDYTPAAVGADNGALDIGSNDPDEGTVSVTLSGTGTSAGQPRITNPIPGSTLESRTVTFVWTEGGAQVQKWQLYVGAAPGSNDIFDSGKLSSDISQITVNKLPRDGRLIHVRLRFKIDGLWDSADYQYTAVDTLPKITDPAPGSTLTDHTVIFTWTAEGQAVQKWQLWAGSAPGLNNYYDSGKLSPATTQTTADELPTDGSLIYVRLRYKKNDVWKFRDYHFTAVIRVPQIFNPAPDSTLTDTRVLFECRNNGAFIRHYKLWIGTNPGERDIYDSGKLPGMDTSHTASGLPFDGRRLYLRFKYKSGVVWKKIDYQYTAVTWNFMITSPPPKSTLTGSSVTFQWTANGAPVDRWRLTLGSSKGARDIYNSGWLSAATTSVLVSGIPKDGRKIWARLKAEFDTDRHYKDYKYWAK